MKVIVHYTVKHESALENTLLIKSMCDDFNEHQYEGLPRYAAFKGTDDVTLYHFAFMLGGPSPLPSSTGIMGIKHDIKERYDHRPAHMLVSEVGSYAFHTVAIDPPCGGQ